MHKSRADHGKPALRVESNGIKIGPTAGIVHSNATAKSHASTQTGDSANTVACIDEAVQTLLTNVLRAADDNDALGMFIDDFLAANADLKRTLQHLKQACIDFPRAAPDAMELEEFAGEMPEVIALQEFAYNWHVKGSRSTDGGRLIAWVRDALCACTRLTEAEATEAAQMYVSHLKEFYDLRQNLPAAVTSPPAQRCRNRRSWVR